MLILYTYFRWKQPKPSGVLRLEVSLFSGYELFSINPIIEGFVTNFQHGSQGNILWFVFANVTSNCPICVQYLIRSPYVISSLRPAYARIYPATREDLAAETFFHLQTNSVLISGITDDDLITWFGKNDSNRNNLDLESYPGCEHLGSGSTAKAKFVPKASKVTSTERTTQTSTKTPKITETTTASTVKESTTNKMDTTLEKISLVTYTTEKLPTTANIPKTTKAKPLVSTKAPEVRKTKQLKLMPSAILSKKVLLIKKDNQTVAPKQEVKHVTPLPKPTPKIMTTTPLPKIMAEQPTKINIPAKTNETAKHINKEIHPVPPDYEGTIKDVDYSTTESSFPDDKGSSKYVVLDKNELWGMLREVVHDEIDKKEKGKLNVEEKKKEDDAKKLRYQGYT